MFDKTCLLTAFVFLAGAASGATVIYEPFAYDATSPQNNAAFLGDGNQSGALGLGTWSQANSGSNEIDVESPGRTFTDNFANVLPVAGNTMERQVRQGGAVVWAPINSSDFASLTADGSTLWMSFLYQDRGFSGPDFGISLASERMNFGDNESLVAPGFGVGVGINGVGGPARAIGSIVHTNSTAFAFTPENPASMNGPGASNLRLLAMKVLFNADGTDDEIFVFDLTENNILLEPDESSAIASDTFNWTAAQQAMLDTLTINESQVNYLDEIRVADSYAGVIATLEAEDDAAPVTPEPASAALAMLALGGLAMRRRKNA